MVVAGGAQIEICRGVERNDELRHGNESPRGVFGD